MKPFKPVTDLFLAQSRGDEVRPHRPVPHHLCKQTWKYVCVCGHIWKYDGPDRDGADAVWRDNTWQSPLRECLNCHEWTDGARVVEA